MSLWQPQLLITYPWMYIKYRSRFFAQAGHENQFSFIISGHCQTNQNYQQPPQRWQNSCFQSHFSPIKIGLIFRIFFLRRLLLLNLKKKL